MSKIQFIEISPDELANLISEAVSSKIAKLKSEITSNKDEGQLLTREETCEFLKINSTTLWDWTNKGKVTAYGIGNRRYYKKDEILSALQSLKK